MIYNSAVEAAASAQYEQRYGAGKWESCPFPEVWRGMVRPGLEAAAPHMLADAWDAGHDACADELAKYENPYRPTS